MTTSGGGPWHLGIDFGTSFTVAAIAGRSGVTVLDVESNGQSRMPSSVFVAEDGTILVGTAAQHQATFSPDRYEATPKRWIGDGEVFLGDAMVPITELIGGVLRRVYTEACRQREGTQPEVVRLTHPADWGQTRLNVLVEAAQRAGLPEVQLAAEPMAAAVWIAGVTEPGDRIAVFDFGGGTFDAAVLRRTADSFEVIGPPVGRDPLGGEDIDRHIIDYIGSVFESDAPDDWHALVDPQDVAWRRRKDALRMEVQRAKETLSEVTSCQLWIPGLEREMQFSRAELDKLIDGDVNTCVDITLTALADASVTPTDLRGLYLVGGSSRIPLVAETIWRRLGVRPLVQDSPKSVVALGAAYWQTRTEEQAVAAAAAVPSERSVAPAVAPTQEMEIDRTGVGGTASVPPVLRLNFPPGYENLRPWTSVMLQVDRRDGTPSTIRFREEAAGGPDVRDLVNRVGARRARVAGYTEVSAGPATVFGQPGGMRAFTLPSSTGPVRMVERYLQIADRAMIVAFPEAATNVADQITPTLAWPTASGIIESPVSLPRPPGWATCEQLTLRSPDGAVVLFAERAEASDEPVEAWRWHRLEAMLRDMPQASPAGRVAGRMLGGRSAEIVTVRWALGERPMLSKLATTVDEGHAFVLAVHLPMERQSDFPLYAGMVRLGPAVTQTDQPSQEQGGSDVR